MRDNNEMLDLIKALADAKRLKIIGMLVQKPATLAQISEGLSLPTREAFNHLEFLKFVGVVQERDDQYILITDGLEILARRLLSGQRDSYIPEPDLVIDRQKILAKFLNPDGTIRQIPNSRTQRDRFLVVLEYILAVFTPGVVYTEKEVNLLIRQFNEDVCGLRRDLIDAKMLVRERDGSKYWRPDPIDGNPV